MPDSVPITPALNKALKDGQFGPRDAAAVALAKRYALLLDNATPAAKYQKALTEMTRVVRLYSVGLDPRDQDAADEALRVIENALAEHSVASDLGPKLVAVLQQLGLTLAARKEVRPGVRAATGTDDLSRIRAARRGRQHRA